MAKNPAISLRSRWLAEKLKAARRRAGYSLMEAGEYAQVDHSTIGRFERGTHRIRRAYVRELLDFYGVSDDQERGFLLQLADDAWRKDWSDMDVRGLETEFVDLTWLESKAARICVFEPLVVHGLLQTPQYTRELAKARQKSAATSKVLKHITDVRKKRQTIFVGESPTKLSVVFEEPALRRPIGGREALAEQLKSLIDTTASKHIDIHVLPMSVGSDPGNQGPFTYFEMPDPYPEIAYVESLASRTFIEEESRVSKFGRTYDELRRLALSPQKSTGFIRDILKDLA